MNGADFPYAEDFFTDVYHTASIGESTVFGRTDGSKFEYDPMLRNAGQYIEQFIGDLEPCGDLERYSFSLFKGIDEKKESCILFEMRIISRTINSIVGIPSNTLLGNIKSSFLGNISSKKDTLNLRTNEVGILQTNIYPDAPYILSLNYEDFPIGYIAFDIIGNIIYVQQIQASNIMDEYTSFENGRNHLLQGFEWRKVLITFLEDYLKVKNFSGRIIIQAGENNSYHSTNISDDPEKRKIIEERNVRLLYTYNETATSLGYIGRVDSLGRKKEVRDFLKTI